MLIYNHGIMEIGRALDSQNPERGVVSCDVLH